MGFSIVNQKIEQWSAEYSGPKFHAVLCDPPYGLEFMGKEWDKFDVRQPGDPTFHKSGVGPFDRSKVRHSTSSSYGDSAKALAGFQIRVTAWGEAIFPHLYPGALVLMFGGTRTWHRLACGMEDAGFEIWDTMMWLHAQGFPKAQAIDKLIDAKNGDEREVVGPNPNARKADGNRQPFSCEGGGGGKQHHPPLSVAASDQSAPWSGYKTTALKPAWEPVLCFKKPLTGTYAEMAMQYGSGALNVDGGRIGWPNGKVPEIGTPGWGGPKKTLSAVPTIGGDTVDRTPPSGLGRYPANLILDHESAAMLDEQTGELTSGEPMGMKTGGQMNCYGVYAGGVPVTGFGDSGGASRFYYCAKASTAERNAGLEGFEARNHADGTGRNQSLNSGYRMENGVATGPKADSSKMRNHHPTVKPIDLCRYLATLLLPPDSVQPRRLLVPFAGSGSEMIGAMLAGWDEIVGVEQDTEHGYVQIAEARLDWWKWAKETSRLSDPTAILQRFGLSSEPDDKQPTLFGEQPEQLAL